MSLSKLKGSGKKKSRLGILPEAGETSGVLDAPEHAPAQPKNTTKNKSLPVRKKKWGTTVQEDFPQRIKMVAVSRGCSVVELLEQWLNEAESKN